MTKAKNEPKQVIVVRRDLNMGQGKCAAQVAHAAMGALLSVFQQSYVSKQVNKKRLVYELDRSVTDPVAIWLTGQFVKVVLYVDSEEELYDIEAEANAAGLVTALIEDEGRTEFNGIKTSTCLGIGPDFSDKINRITGHLKLLR